MAEKIRRTKEQIVEELDKKIAYHQGIIDEVQATAAAKVASHKAHIEKLEAKKEATLNPKPRTYTRKKGMKTVMDKAKEMGLSAEEIAKKLGISLD